MELVKNEHDCCVWEPTEESEVIERTPECDTDCMIQPESNCGLEHPVGSGTLAGCKATTLPHFGVVLSKRDDTCHAFGYYTSGNTEEYEGVCGDIQLLEHTVTTEPCVTTIAYTATPCVPCTPDVPVPPAGDNGGNDDVCEPETDVEQKEA